MIKTIIKTKINVRSLRYHSFLGFFEVLLYFKPLSDIWTVNHHLQLSVVAYFEAENPPTAHIFIDVVWAHTV